MPLSLIYMDYNATTPCDQRVLDAMLPYFREQFGNAASHTHPFGWIAREAVELAREQIAGLIGAEKEEIIFTSGSTEAINLALKGVFELYAGKGNHIITCQTEHSAVLDTCEALERKGAEITYLPVNEKGEPDLNQLEEAIQDHTILIALMYANNETGNIHPIKEISGIARAHHCLFFSDATQAVGKLKVDVNEDGIDLMALSGHKIYGPKGIGVLYLRRRKPRARVAEQIHGGGHENGMRSGTLNVPAIVGMGKAAEICSREYAADAQRISRLRDKLEQELTIFGVVNGDSTHRLPNVTNLRFAGYPGNDLIQRINEHVAVSSGSACTSALPEPSHVLMAMGLEEEAAKKSIRFSLGRPTTEEEIDYAIEKLKKILKK